jgi:APA family basic amino acid/polyamine antiporter
MVVLVFSGSFFILADMYIFILWLFNLLIISGLFILRKKMPNASRPYKVWGYPWMPVLLIVFNASYLVMTVYNDVGNYLSGKTHIINSFFGLVLTAVGVPLYWWFGRNKKKLEK